ncbi:glycosyltransferase family 39 protein [Polyangium sorediatum]|uniref:Glycosyltransferase family 39 protein n=1 Tax=Polyangium sorediatum TaxID=889274 RepID=A0ABT6NQ92_9BACT|nr:glycosyltransferase family 39 protein [Polyangium sorediatum]MDI1430484.1 glycosyltransferase family 39 protein [Polyangium sorediatum]
MTSERASPRRRDTWIVLAAALLARLAVVAWAASRFPPTADGTFYHRIAERVAAGLGYTWLWPDGVVTYAAHYPVGYPALLGGAYAIFGAHPGVAMTLNALLGALAAVAVHRLAARAAPPGAALAAGLLVALHPGLVAYTPALMSEGVTASLVACAAWAAAWVRDAVPLGARRTIAARTALLGLVVGLATLVRPQSLVFAPLFALLALAPLAGPRARRVTLGFAALATACALAVCAPWTIRNCERMNRCALVSVNGGWNLLIGADPASTGAWSPIKVPDACREVWDEAGKDACFGRAATLYITEHPGAWLSLVPRKLAATFDYCGAAGWYLHESNGAACGDRCKLGLGVVETVYERGVLGLALLGLARAAAESRARRLATRAVVGVGLVFLFLVHAWVAYAALVVAALFGGRTLLRGPVLPAAAVTVLGATLLTHAVFFGAGRYGLVTFPLLAGMAGLVFAGFRTRA